MTECNEGTRVLIEMVMHVVVFPQSGELPINKENDIRQVLLDYYNSKGLGENIYVSDLVAVIEKTEGVDRVDVPFQKMARRGQVGSGDIVILDYEYPRLDSVLFI